MLGLAAGLLVGAGALAACGPTAPAPAPGGLIFSSLLLNAPSRSYTLQTTTLGQYGSTTQPTRCWMAKGGVITLPSTTRIAGGRVIGVLYNTLIRPPYTCPASSSTNIRFELPLAALNAPVLQLAVALTPGYLRQIKPFKYADGTATAEGSFNYETFAAPSGNPWLCIVRNGAYVQRVGIAGAGGVYTLVAYRPAKPAGPGDCAPNTLVMMLSSAWSSMN